MAVALSTAALVLAVARASGTPADLPGCSLEGFTFAANDGHGVGTLIKGAASVCDAVHMACSDSDGVAAAFASPKIPVTPARRLTATFDVTTTDLIPIKGGPGAGAAALTGGVYLHFFDKDGDSGAWNPQYGTLAPSNTHGLPVRTTASFIVPTTAASVQIYLAFAAHSDLYRPNRMLSGRATGEVVIGNLSFTDEGPVDPPPSTITVGNVAVQAALEQAFACLHNSQASGNFTVGAGYTISGNISPDLTFGLHGIRRTGYPNYLATILKQWAWHAPDPSTGKYTAGRVMGQIYWPLGVVEIFSFTGNVSYLEEMLPLADLSLAYVNGHADAQGLVTLVPVGQGRVGGGGDWVDWYKTRLQGRTFQFHMWYVRTLEVYASLHTEFASTFGNSTRAQIYAQRAAGLRVTLQSLWREDHWLTNPDYPDEGEWLDDSVWSVYHGIATAEQAAVLWAKIDKNVSFFEGVPTRWGAFPTPHWACSWFGRLGGGDIMARFRTGQMAKGQSLLESFSDTVVAHGNIYEGYDMHGCGLQKCGCTTAGYGDYLEHCGGLIWTVTEAVFGLDTRSNGSTWAASVTPRVPPAWGVASLRTVLRGHPLNISWAPAAAATSPDDAQSMAWAADDRSPTTPRGTLILMLGVSVAANNGSVAVKVVGCGTPKAPSGVVSLTPGQPFTALC